MNKRYIGKNNGFWMGTVVELPKQVHRDGNKEWFSMKVRVNYQNNELVCPVVFSKITYQSVKDNLHLHDTVEIAGCWKAEDVFQNEKQKTIKKQYVEASTILITKEENQSFQQVEIEGILVKKLTKRKWRKDGKLLLNAKGNPVPLKDKQGKFLYTIRTGRDGKVLNDYTIACNVKQEDGVVVTHYIPCVSYEKDAKKVAYKIDIGEAVIGNGYVKMRKNAKNEKIVYEVVLTNVEKVS